MLNGMRFIDPETESDEWMPELFEGIVAGVKYENGIDWETVFMSLGAYAQALGFKVPAYMEEPRRVDPGFGDEISW